VGAKFNKFTVWLGKSWRSLAAGAGAVALWIWFAHYPAPSFSSPNFWDVLVGNRLVVAGIRVALLFAAVYVVYSVVVLIGRRRPITKAGPGGFEAAEAAAEASKAEAQGEAQERLRDERDLLVQRLTTADQELRRNRAIMIQASREIRRLKAQLNPPLMEPKPGTVQPGAGGDEDG
jgi:hypothetical protein